MRIIIAALVVPAVANLALGHWAIGFSLLAVATAVTARKRH